MQSIRIDVMTKAQAQQIVDLHKSGAPQEYHNLLEAIQTLARIDPPQQ